jgi:TetR/AcrR family transcriptional regulator, fatty acid metabolism regulator protein
MMSRKNITEARVEQILAAATAVFSRKGFQQARMDDIVAESGLSKGTLYWYFESKDKIILAIMRRLIEEQLKLLESLLESSDSVTGRLLLFARHSSSELEVLQRQLPIGFECYALAGRDETVRQHFRAFFCRAHEIVAALLEQGVAQGEFRDIDVEETATVLIAAHEGLEMLWLMDPQATDLISLKERAVRLLLHSLRP